MAIGVDMKTAAATNVAVQQKKRKRSGANTIRWRMLNADRVEVSPESREHAWKDLLIDILKNSPASSTFRTAVTKADFEYFDYNRPIIYEMKENTLLINSEFFNVALNRPTRLVTPMNVMSIHVLLAFICSLLLALVAAYVSTLSTTKTDTSAISDNRRRPEDVIRSQ
ncbi:ORF81 [Leucania separata nucleopolyhedrovirus]|uniref:ORF81 n=1 Tax=Leucania separata nucleopolyhedrovirus TaxID=1307956 RepID=Q0IL38_NPVLS|nr:ORF81 [Leucania separata nucleopolyhedrovirus]AAR28845.1 ORF81 [Leucania separata nucleopolyhedrovirus]